MAPFDSLPNNRLHCKCFTLNLDMSHIKVGFNDIYLFEEFKFWWTQNQNLIYVKMSFNLTQTHINVSLIYYLTHYPINLKLFYYYSNKKI